MEDDDGANPPRRPGLRGKRQPPPLEKSAPKRKSVAQSCRETREKLKQDPVAYERHKKFENLRIKQYKLSMSEAKKAEYREKTKLRVQRCRAKKAAEGLAQATLSKVMTRAEKDKKKEQWRQKKQKQHSKESQAQRAARNARRRQLYEEKKEKKDQPSKSENSFETESALRKAVYRLKKVLPRSREKSSSVIAKIVQSGTPNKRKMLKDKLLSPRSKKKLEFLDNVISEMDTFKLKRNKDALKRKRIIANLLVKKYKCTVKQSKCVGVSYKLLKRVKNTSSEADLDQRKKRKDATSDNVRDLVQSFFRRKDVSKALPDARAAKKQHSSDSVGRSVMERSMDSALELFTAENPDLNLSRSVFAGLRPKDVMPSTNCRKRDCLCEYCANIDLKLEALRLFSAKKGVTGITFKDRYDISRATLCPKGATGEYSRTCLERSCTNCGTSAVEIQLRPLLETHTQEVIVFHKWETITQDDGKTRMTRLRKTVSAPEFVAALCEDLKPFSRHIFDAQWQGRQYSIFEGQVPEGHLLVCQDFAENFKLHFQDEAQGAHWSYNQATLHASVASYKCQEEGCNQMTREAAIFVSNCNKHDSHAVHTYDKLLMGHFQEKQFNKVIFFSDGAPSQYKNKTSFADLSFFEKDFGVKAERHFFGSRHGKGPCDREFGTLKGALGHAIRNRRAELDTAFDLFQFAQNKYTRPHQEDEHVHYKRTFFFVPKEDVERDRDRLNNLKPLPNTRRSHSVRMAEPYVVSYRERSCFCAPCMGEIGVCAMQDATGDWNVASLSKRRRRREPCRNDVPEPDNDVADNPPEVAEDNRPGVAVNPPELAEDNRPGVADNPPEVAEDNPPEVAEDNRPGVADSPPEVAEDNRLGVADNPPEVAEDNRPGVADNPPEVTEDNHPGVADNPPEVAEDNRPGVAGKSAPASFPLPGVEQAVVSRDDMVQVQHRSLDKGIQAGSWVIVQYPTKRGGSRCYRGLVISHDKDSQEAEVKFLRSRGPYYVFPDIDDIAWANLNDMTVLTAPNANSRLQYFF